MVCCVHHMCSFTVAETNLSKCTRRCLRRCGRTLMSQRHREMKQVPSIRPFVSSRSKKKVLKAIFAKIFTILPSHLNYCCFCGNWFWCFKRKFRESWIAWRRALQNILRGAGRSSREQGQLQGPFKNSDKISSNFLLVFWKKLLSHFLF